jgi:hypothetical protein
MVLAAALMLGGAPAPAAAQSNETPPLRVTVNHAEVITLQSAASIALIANPDIADIVNERNNLIFVLGRKPGATNLLVYDESGKRIFGREILVVPEDGRLVTITRETDVTDYYCQPHCRFYEHEQGGAPPAPPSNAGTPAPAGAAAAGAGGQSPNLPTPPQASPPPYTPSVSLRPGNL